MVLCDKFYLNVKDIPEVFHNKLNIGLEQLDFYFAEPRIALLQLVIDNHAL